MCEEVTECRCEVVIRCEVVTECRCEVVMGACVR